MVAYTDGKICSADLDKAYILNGFWNWKYASVSVREHECSKCYTESVQKVITLPKRINDVGEMFLVKIKK